MKAVADAVRQMLAIVIAIAAIAGAGYLLSHKLDNPDHFVYLRYAAAPQPPGYCERFNTGEVIHPGEAHVPPCQPPTRAAWQIPLAVLLAITGLGAAAMVGSGTGRAASRPVARLGQRPLA